MDPQSDDNQHTSKHQKRIGLIMIVAMWAVLLVLLSTLFDHVHDAQKNPNQALTTNYIGDSVREVELQRNRFGHYVTDGSINGHPVVFMLDTGATGVAIPEHIARQLDLQRGMSFRTQTANGFTTVYATRLNSISVADIELNNVSAAIIPSYKADEILLGMSFLKQIEFTQRGDKLILKQLITKKSS